LTGDYVGKRFATFSNDASVGSYFLAAARIAFKLPETFTQGHKAEISLNVTNLSDVTGASTVSVGSATNSYSAYPIPPRQWFLTFATGF